MKKYFAKYLPVEGDIEEGDVFLYQDRTVQCSGREKDILYGPKTGNFATTLAIPEKTKTYNSSGGFAGWKINAIKVKLFLCSRDIQVGDEVIDVSSNNIKRTCVDIKDDTYFFTPQNSRGTYGNCSGRYVEMHMYKVTGEISPEATWVKEGDEFDEKEIKISRHYRLDDGKLSRKLRKKDFHNKEVKLVKILGPCGHFH